MIDINVLPNMTLLELSNEFLRIVLIPEVGGKTISIYHKPLDFELLDQPNPADYNRLLNYEENKEFLPFGFDDCFPSIDPSSEYYDSKLVSYPDHGELWSSSFEYKLESNNSLSLSCNSNILPYRFTKKLTLMEDTLIIDYGIENIGNLPIEGFYTLHCLIRCEEDMLLTFPKDMVSVLNVLESDYLGQKGTPHTFPETKDLFDKHYDFTRIKKANCNKYEKFYFQSFITEGFCSAYYPSKNITAEISYDSSLLPYLGFWITEGGYNGYYNCAFEPSNGYYDSMNIARTNNKFGIIAPKQQFKFQIQISLKAEPI